jgi:hypothetical protein
MGLTTDTQDVPVRLVGSSVFGINQTVSVERTYNMYVTSSGDGEEECLINFPGYRALLALVDGGAEGRGVYRSVRGGFIIAVVAADVFRINLLSEVATQIGTISSTTGEVVFAENLSSQICFVDGSTAYIYNYASAPSAIGTAVYNSVPGDTNFTPNYVCYHNTYFIFGNARTDSYGSQWVIFQEDVGSGIYDLLWIQTLALQSKSDFAKAVIPIPGKANNILVFGSTVAEIWNNIGGLIVYQRNSAINIDYGAASVSTIAANDEVVAWLGINEQSKPALMAMRGGAASRISTDGIDYLLAQVVEPASSTAVLFRNAGHLFYVLTFFGDSDNFSIVYDFTANKIYDLTDWDFTAFPARQIVYFNEKILFINYKDGGIYEINTNFNTFDSFANDAGVLVDKIYNIPCVRLSNTFRVQGRPEKFKAKIFTFPMECGTTLNAFAEDVCTGYLITEDTEQIIYTEDGLPMLAENGYCYTNRPRVDLTISKNGGITFSNTVSYLAKPTGDFKCQPRFNNLGYANQLTFQLRFWGTGRKVIRNGTVEIGD